MPIWLLTWKGGSSRDLGRVLQGNMGTVRRRGVSGMAGA